MDVRTLLAVAVLIFGAGGIYAGFKRQGRDLNGLGRKQQVAADEQARFQRRVIVALLKGAKSEEEKEWLADHFRE